MKERLLENSEISQALKQCEELCSTARQQLEESKVRKYIIHCYNFVNSNAATSKRSITTITKKITTSTITPTATTTIKTTATTKTIIEEACSSCKEKHDDGDNKKLQR